MSGTPRISLVIPNFDSGPVLERGLQSIFAQHDPNLQLIMADAGSTDESRDIIERHRRRFDVLISERDDGQADGLNKGFRRADGELRGWLCADDELQPGALAHFRAVFAANPDAGIVTGSCERLFPDGSAWVQPSHPDPWSVIGVQNVIEQPSTLWRSDAHRRVGELDPSFHLGFDWDLWCRLRNAGVRIVTTDRVQSRYHFTADNKCGSAGNLFAREAYTLIKSYGPLRGRLASLYRFIYERFDLPGCLDKPPTATPLRQAAYRAFQVAVCSVGGLRWLKLYNWHFAALQERGLRWW